MNGVMAESGEPLDVAIGPPHHDGRHRCPPAQTEVDADVVVREIASATSHVGGLARPLDFEPHSRTNRIAIVRRSDQLQGDPVVP
jgi:hypothetical protein